MVEDMEKEILKQIYLRYPTERDVLNLLESTLWEKKPQCPYCSSKNQTPLKMELRYHCNACNTSYSVTVGTLFHKTRLPLQKWILAIIFLFNDPGKYTSLQLSNLLEVNRNTAWRISQKIKESVFYPEQRNLLQKLLKKTDL